MEQNSREVVAEPAAALANGMGSALFVINLCASMAPISVAGKSLPGLESYRLYQVARAEDGRTRHRLRLGFFSSEADAEQALGAVRDLYPTAFTACLGDEDRKFARGFLPESAPAAPAAKPQISVVVDNDSTRPLKVLRQDAVLPEKPVAISAPQPSAVAPSVPSVPKPAATTTPASRQSPTVLGTAAAERAQPRSESVPNKSVAAEPLTVADSIALEVATTTAPLSAQAPSEHRGIVATKAPSLDAIDLTLDDMSAAAAPDSIAAKPASGPFHVGKGIELPATDLTLDAEKPAGTAAQQAPAERLPTVAAPTATAQAFSARDRATAKGFTPATRSAGPTATATARSAPAPRPQADLDSTQTIRALTAAELNDESQEKWFAIQLAVSEQPVNLDAMPHLDIFEAYRLYSIATAGSGKITHSLRIGFFREQVSAEAVSGYLKTFFPSPSIVRISVAEQTRFKDPPARPASAPVVDRSRDGKVVALSEARARSDRPVIPTVTMEVPTPAAADSSSTGSFKPNATGSFKTSATGTHPAVKTAARGAAPATKRSQPVATNKGTTGKQHAPVKKSLSQALLDEARSVELSESAVRKLPKSGSLLARLVGKLSK